VEGSGRKGLAVVAQCAPSASFLILGYLLLVRALSTQSRPMRTAASAVQVALISSALGGKAEVDKLGSFSLHYEQVQWFRLRDAQHCQNRVSLPAMVRFMIEQMGENFSSSLSLRGSIQSSVVPAFLESGFVKGLNECDDSAVLFCSRSAQGPKILKQNRVEFFGVIPRSCETPHPDAVGDQKMIKSAVKTPEIGANLLAI
jgi:hypothetical protein